MTKIIFHKSHMIKVHTSGLIHITRFADNAAPRRFEFKTRYCFDDALAWGKRWVEKVRY